MPSDNPKSTWKLAGHPTHPALVPFPIAFLIGALVTDIVYRHGGDPFFARASFYLLGAGIVTALAAAVVGFTDFVGEPRIRALSHAWQHLIGNLVAVLLSIYNFYIRLGDHEGPIRGQGLYVSILVVLILGFTGWRGGDLVFRHRVGVADDRTADTI